MFWYRGLRPLPLGKSVYIISAAPAFSLFFAYVILREVPTAFQIMGFSLTLSGVYFLITRRKFRMPMPDPV
jgi:drug/metabolite transporter (DMT)-like permease